MTTAYTATWTPAPQQCTIHIPDIDPAFRAYRRTTHLTWIMLRPPVCTATMEHLVMYHKQQIIWAQSSQTNVIKKLFTGKSNTRWSPRHRDEQHHNHRIRELFSLINTVNESPLNCWVAHTDLYNHIIRLGHHHRISLWSSRNDGETTQKTTKNDRKVLLIKWSLPMQLWGWFRVSSIALKKDDRPSNPVNYRSP